MRAIRHLHEQTDYTLVKLLTALDYPKSTYHYHLQRLDQPDKDHALKEAIRSIRATHKDYGYRRIYRELLRRGVKVSENKVQCLLYSKSGPLFSKLPLKMGPLIFMLTIHD